MLLGCLYSHFGQAAESVPAEAWFTNGIQYPRTVATNSVRSQGFESLHGEAVAGRIILFWKPEFLDTNASVILMASADEPGHWPVRDWRSYPMKLTGSQWQARVPVEDVDVAVLYFVQSIMGGTTNISPMRICHPRALGLEMSTRPFWPFLEGFEKGLESWSLAGTGTNSPALGIDSLAKNGNSALKVSLPAGQHAITAATTRVRGWQIQQNTATGLRLWLRTKSGTGRARFTLFSNAFSTNQVMAASSVEARLTAEWQKVNLPLKSFPGIAVGGIDWFSIEFIGDGPIDFLIDDMQYIGPWNIEVE